MEHKIDKDKKLKERIYIESDFGRNVYIAEKSTVLENRKKYNCVLYIISFEDNYEPNNFCCDRCAKIYLTNKKINTLVIESSYRFTEMLKDKVRKKEHFIYSYLKKKEQKIKK